MLRSRLISTLACIAALPCLVGGESALAKQLSAPKNTSHERMLFAEMSEVHFQAGGVSLDQAIAMVQSKYGARVMRANTVEEDGRMVHYIRLMTADRSRVWTVRVDAATGREF
jgi:uncharacterized membrane protein YkoI